MRSLKEQIAPTVMPVIRIPTAVERVMMAVEHEGCNSIVFVIFVIFVCATPTTTVAISIERGKAIPIVGKVIGYSPLQKLKRSETPFSTVIQCPPRFPTHSFALLRVFRLSTP